MMPISVCGIFRAFLLGAGHVGPGMSVWLAYCSTEELFGYRLPLHTPARNLPQIRANAVTDA